ncbi:MAG: bifunctional riboflavin kinase/FAD synthetase [Alphaproteobacteria bacterium]
MQYFERYKDLPTDAQKCVIVIGNFDGVHLGHQALLSRAKEKARALNVPLGVLTFEPHPRQLFRSDEPPCRITPSTLKRDRLSICGVDYVFSLPFDWDFASQSATDFVQEILIDGLNASHVFVGFDFKFGQLRKGTPQTITDAGLTVTVIDEVKNEKHEGLSSSRIRQLLRHGKIEEANAVLGWNWKIGGVVVEGDKRGRELGFPTANMKLDQTIHPAYGIYACYVQIEGEEDRLMGACNIGIRPMFEVPVAQVETFIFDFNREIYGQTVYVQPVKRLRGEAKFNSLDDLITQMDKDCEQSRRLLENIA